MVIRGSHSEQLRRRAIDKVIDLDPGLGRLYVAAELEDWRLGQGARCVVPP